MSSGFLFNSRYFRLLEALFKTEPTMILHASHVVPNLYMVPASGNIVKAFDTLPFLSHLSFLSFGSVIKQNS